MYTVTVSSGATGVKYRVIAPALISRRPGDRVKTDRRDARKLVHQRHVDLGLAAAALAQLVRLPRRHHRHDEVMAT